MQIEDGSIDLTHAVGEQKFKGEPGLPIGIQTLISKFQKLLVKQMGGVDDFIGRIIGISGPVRFIYLLEIAGKLSGVDGRIHTYDFVDLLFVDFFNRFKKV